MSVDDRDPDELRRLVETLIKERDEARAEVERVTQAATLSCEVAESERRELEAQAEEREELITGLGQICCGVAFTSGQYEEHNERALKYWTCAFCGAENEKTPEAMGAHLEVCTKHPAAKLRAELAIARAFADKECAARMEAQVELAKARAELAAEREAQQQMLAAVRRAHEALKATQHERTMMCCVRATSGRCYEMTRVDEALQALVVWVGAT